MNFLAELESTMATLAEHLKPSAGAYVESIVVDAKNILGTMLSDIKAELAYLHSRIDQIDPSVSTQSVASVSAPPELPE